MGRARWMVLGLSSLLLACGETSKERPGGNEEDPYSFSLVPALASGLPEDAPTSKLATAVTAKAISEDGSLLAGTTTFSISTDGAAPLVEEHAFSWSEGTGTKELSGEPQCIAADGSFVIGYGSVGLLHSMYRATATGDAKRVETPALPNIVTFGLDQCARDASAVTARIETEVESEVAQVPLLWRANRDDRFVELEFPDALPQFPIAMRLSADGSHLVAQVSVDTLGSSRFYRFSTDGPDEAMQPVANPEGYSSCVLEQLSDDGAVIRGTCGEAVVRWTGADEPSVIPELLWGLGMSSDGTVVLGAVAPTQQLAVWNDGILDTAQEAGTWVSIVGAGPRAVAVAMAESGEPLRWTAAEGFVPLPKPAGVPTALVNGQSADGQLAIGLVPSNDSGHFDGVVWDALGSRDLRAELVSAGLDLTRLHDLNPLWVGVEGDRIRVIGQLSQVGTPEEPAEATTQVWVATLPLRSQP